MDFLRHAAFSQGRVLILDEVPPGGSGGVGAALVAAVLAEGLRLSWMRALSVVQCRLGFPVRPDFALSLGEWFRTRSAGPWRSGGVRVGCLCGACAWEVDPVQLDHGSSEVTEEMPGVDGPSGGLVGVYLEYL